MIYETRSAILYGLVFGMEGGGMEGGGMEGGMSA